MITSEKLAIYREYRNEDDWQRAGSPKRDVLADEDWVVICKLLQEISMLKRNLVSREYGEQIRKRLTEMTADEKTAQELLNLA